MASSAIEQLRAQYLPDDHAIEVRLRQRSEGDWTDFFSGLDVATEVVISLSAKVVMADGATLARAVRCHTHPGLEDGTVARSRGFSSSLGAGFGVGSARREQVREPAWSPVLEPSQARARVRTAVLAGLGPQEVLAVRFLLHQDLGRSEDVVAKIAVHLERSGATARSLRTPVLERIRSPQAYPRLRARYLDHLRDSSFLTRLDTAMLSVQEDTNRRNIGIAELYQPLSVEEEVRLEPPSRLAAWGKKPRQSGRRSVGRSTWRASSWPAAQWSCSSAAPEVERPRRSSTCSSRSPIPSILTRACPMAACPCCCGPAAIPAGAKPSAWGWRASVWIRKTDTVKRQRCWRRSARRER